MEVGAGPRSRRGHLTVGTPRVTSFLSGSLNWKHVQDEWGAWQPGGEGFGFGKMILETVAIAQGTGSMV